MNLPLRVCQSGDLGFATVHGEEYVTRDTTELYMDKTRKAMKEFGFSLASFLAPAQH